MGLKPGEHGTLVFGREVKEAVPCNQSVETLTQRKLTHVCEMDLCGRQISPKQLDHCGSGIYRRHVETSKDQFAGNGQPRPATDVEHGGTRRKQATEALKP